MKELDLTNLTSADMNALVDNITRAKMINQPSEVQLFLDCDGVLADFDKFFIEQFQKHPREFEAEHGASRFWHEIRNFPGGFFNQLDLMHDALELVDATRHMNPTILTGMPLGDDWAKLQKLEWRDKHLPGITMICCQSKEKYTNMHEGKHNVIVDDWFKYKTLWEEKGGTFILHTSARESIASLTALGLLL